jgi:hypothetical protein
VLENRVLRRMFRYTQEELTDVGEICLIRNFMICRPTDNLHD